MIADGEFEVSAKGRRLRGATRGDVIGEVALLASISATATVTALTPGSVLRIGRGPFLVALTGHDVESSSEAMDFTRARERFRDVVAALQRDSKSDSTDRADSWLGLGAVGRVLADPTFTDVLARSAKMARAANNEVLLAEAAALTTWPGAFFFIAENPHHEMIDVCEAALATLRADDPMRVRVLATLASNLTFASGPERRVELIREAHELASAHDDLALTGAVLNAEFICMWEPGTSERRRHIGQMVTDIGVRTGDAELMYIGGFFEAYCAAEGGLLADARQRLVDLRDMLPATHNQYFEFLGERLILSIDIARGEPGVHERIDALAERHGRPTPTPTAPGRCRSAPRIPGRHARVDGDRHLHDARRPTRAHVARRSRSGATDGRRCRRCRSNARRTGRRAEELLLAHRRTGAG